MAATATAPLAAATGATTATAGTAATTAAPVTAAAAAATPIAAACLGEALAEVLLPRRLLHLVELGTLLALGHALLHPLPGAGRIIALLVPLLALHLEALPCLALLKLRHHVRLTALASLELRPHRSLGHAPTFEHLPLPAPVRLA